MPLTNENGADFENAAFILNPPAGQFIVIAGKGDQEYYFSEGDSNNITCKCVCKPCLIYL